MLPDEILVLHIFPRVCSEWRDLLLNFFKKKAISFNDYVNKLIATGHLHILQWVYKKYKNREKTLEERRQLRISMLNDEIFPPFTKEEFTNFTDLNVLLWIQTL